MRLKNFLEHKKFFYANQFGFREGRNVQQAVIKTTNFISKALNENNVVAGLFLDVSKAFDTIDNKDDNVHRSEAYVKCWPNNRLLMYISHSKVLC